MCFATLRKSFLYSLYSDITPIPDGSLSGAFFAPFTGIVLYKTEASVDGFFCEA